MLMAQHDPTGSQVPGRRSAPARSTRSAVVNDDWRLRIELGEEGIAHALSQRLTDHELEHDLESAFHDRVVVSLEGPVVFCYAGTRDQAERARELVQRVGAEHGWKLQLSLAHWHPTAEEWEDPDTPLPDSPASVEEEREERVAQERHDSAEQGYPEFEVRVQCTSRHDAAQLSQRLQDEDIPHVHRWSYLLIGATDEDSAQALAQRLRGEAPDGATVTTERNQRAIYEHRAWSPFSLLGGLGG